MTFFFPPSQDPLEARRRLTGAHSSAGSEGRRFTGAISSATGSMTSNQLPCWLPTGPATLKYSNTLASSVVGHSRSSSRGVSQEWTHSHSSRYAILHVKRIKDISSTRISRLFAWSCQIWPTSPPLLDITRTRGDPRLDGNCDHATKPPVSERATTQVSSPQIMTPCYFFVFIHALSNISNRTKISCQLQ
jgi:hypothetical protein